MRYFEMFVLGVLVILFIGVMEQITGVTLGVVPIFGGF